MLSDVKHRYRTIACRRCGDTFHVPISCGNRFCSICSGPRRRRVRAKLDAIVSHLRRHKQYSLKMLTLTIPNQEDIHDGFTKILHSFRRLRQRSFWKWKVKGGCWVVEVTGKPSAWHVHIHALLECKYIRHSLLKRHWMAVSDGSIVYIQQIHTSRAIGYVTKYISKGTVPEAFQLYISHGLKGARLFQVFGSWHNISLRVPKISYVCPECGYTHFRVVPDEPLSERLSSRSPPDVWNEQLYNNRIFHERLQQPLD
jgi:ribosomal protein L37E